MFSVEMMYKYVVAETVPYWHVGEWVEFTGGQRYLKPTSPDSQGRAPTLMHVANSVVLHSCTVQSCYIYFLSLPIFIILYHLEIL